MTDRKPLLMNKEMYNLLNNGTNKSEPKDKLITPETPEKMLKSLQGIFCKGRYQSWIIYQNNPNSKKIKKSKRG